jgi:hypothetical protein
VAGLGVLRLDLKDILIFNDRFFVFAFGKIFFGPAPMAFLLGLLAAADESDCKNEDPDHETDLAEFFG